MTETTDTSALMDITSRPPVVYVKGHGSWLEDSEGNAFHLWCFAGLFERATSANTVRTRKIKYAAA